METTNIPHIGVEEVNEYPHENVDVSGNDIAIFDTIKDLPVNYYPTKVNAAVLAVVLKGSARFTINLQEYEVKAHNLILLMPNQIVQIQTSTDDFAGVYIAISPKAVQDVTLGVQSNINTFLYVQSNPITVIDEREETMLMTYHSFIWEQIKDKSNIYRKRIDNHLILALVLEIMNIVNGHRPQHSSTRSRKEEQFGRFLKLVGTDYCESRTVSYYADQLCITPKYLSSLSKSLTGITAREWIDRCVVLEAKALLKNSSNTIQEVADILHFPNQSFFGKYFKHHVGCSPKEYRSR